MLENRLKFYGLNTPHKGLQSVWEGGKRLGHIMGSSNPHTLDHKAKIGRSEGGVG